MNDRNTPIELTRFSPEPVALPYVIEEVTTEEALAECVALRSDAYSRHNGELGELFHEPEHEDRDPHFTNLVVRSKLSGQLLAAVRIEIRNPSESLGFESSFRLPGSLRDGPIAEVSRLAVANRVGYSPRLMTIKAAYWFCRLHGVKRLFVTARSPVDRMYKKFEMHDVIPNEGKVPMKSIANIPHRIMYVDVFNLSVKWMESGNPILQPFFMQCHPDLLDDIQIKTVHRELSGTPVVAAGQGA